MGGLPPPCGPAKVCSTVLSTYPGVVPHPCDLLPVQIGQREGKAVLLVGSGGAPLSLLRELCRDGWPRREVQAGARRIRIGKPPRGDSVGICRTRSCQPGSRSRRNERRMEAAIARTSSSPKRIPMQILGPPPNGT